MIFGMSTFAFVHTVLSMVALISGVAVTALFGSKRHASWTAIFFASAVATSATGFGFASPSFMPSHWVGVVSLVVLATALVARYVFHLAGPWHWIYAVGVVLGLYFLIFVSIAQAFMKIPALKAMAPTLSELPFTIVQGIAMVIFVGFAIAAAVKFRPAPAT